MDVEEEQDVSGLADLANASGYCIVFGDDGERDADECGLRKSKAFVGAPRPEGEEYEGMVQVLYDGGQSDRCGTTPRAVCCTRATWRRWGGILAASASDKSMHDESNA